MKYDATIKMTPEEAVNASNAAYNALCIAQKEDAASYEEYIRHWHRVRDLTRKYAETGEGGIELLQAMVKQTEHQKRTGSSRVDELRQAFEHAYYRAMAVLTEHYGLVQPL